MGLDTDLYTTLHANWDTNVIREPEFNLTRMEDLRNGVGDYNIVTHKERNSKAIRGLSAAFVKEWRRFSLIFYEDEEADLDKVMQQTELILLTLSPVSNGWYEIDEDYDDGLEGKTLSRTIRGQRVQSVDKGA